MLMFFIIKKRMGFIVSEDKTLKRMALYMFAIMAVMICFVVALRHRVEQEPDPEEIEKEILMSEGTDLVELPSPTPTPPNVEAVAQGGHAEESKVWELWQFLAYASMEELEPELSERCILIKKPAEQCEYEILDDLINHKFTFRVVSSEDFLQAASVLRVYEGEFYYGTVAEGEFLTEFGVLNMEENGRKVTEFSFLPDGYYVQQVMEKEDYYIIKLLKYKDVYEKIVVLDAGHGGKDPGAGAENYKVKESVLALKMLLYLKEMLEENTDIKVLCTRTEDVKLELYQRVELALGTEADLFISFHCNASESKSRNGSEVLYNNLQGVDDAFNSKSFASLCLTKLVNALGTKRGGIADRQDLHIVRRATMPVVLLETAYLSNENDLAKLKEEENLKAIAAGIYEAILEAYELMGEEE